MTEKNIIGIESRENQMPVFRSDIMKIPEDRVKPVSGIREDSQIRAVNNEVSSAEAIELWRYLSENLRDRRLEKEKNNSKKFQTDYEKDEINLHSKNPKSFLSDLLMKIRMANLDVDPNLFVHPEPFTNLKNEDDRLRVYEIMTTNVVSVIDSTTVEQVTSILNRKKITGIPVVNYLSKNLIGFISTADIISHIFDEKVISTYNTDGTFFRQDALAILERPISELMQTSFVTVSPQATISDACRIMSLNNIRSVMVSEDNKLKGILSASDLVKLLANEVIEINLKGKIG